MYKIIIIIFLLCVTTVHLKRIDNIRKLRFVGTFNDMGLSTRGMEYPSSNNGVTSRSVRLTRAKRSPLMYLVPVNEERENADNEMTERSRPSRKIKRCKTALCKAGNIPSSGEYRDGIVKATAGESNEEPYGRSSRWKQIRTAKNSMVSKLFKKETDSNENNEDNEELAELLGKNLANENYLSDKKYREKSGKFVCYCQREDCPDCRSSNSKKELIGAPRTRENILAREKIKKDRYRKLLRPKDYPIPKIPLVRLPELYREIPYDLRRNHVGNANKMDVLPIVRGIPANVHPLTVPFRVAYDPADTYLGSNGPVSQGYQQKLNNIYQHGPLKQYTVASKSKSDIPRRPSVSMPRNNGVGSRKNDLTIVTSRPKENANYKDVDVEKSIKDDAFDSNMQECIKLFGKEVCVLAASTNRDNLNKVKNKGNDIFDNKNVGSTRNHYETSSAEEDYYDVTESDLVLSESPCNLINVEENIDDDYNVPTEQSLGNYYDDYYDSTIADVTSEIPEYATSNIENDQILNDDYYDSETPKYVTIDSTEAAILGIASNQEEETTTVLTDTNSNDTTEIEDEKSTDTILDTMLSEEDESSTYESQNEINNNYNNLLDDFLSSTVKVEDENSADTFLETTLTAEDKSSTYESRNENNNDDNDLFNDLSSSTAKVEDEKSLNTILDPILRKEPSQSKNDINCRTGLDDFASTTTESEDETSTDTILGDDRNHYTEETHPGLDYSDIQVVTNGYFTSKGYDESGENYFTGLGPSAYDYHLHNDGSTNFLENSPTYDTNVEPTNMLGIIKDQSNLLGVSPTKSYSDLAKSQFFTDSSMNNNLNIDKTTTEDTTNLLGMGPKNCEGQERRMDNQGKESALQYGKFDPAITVTTKSESEPQEITTDSFLGYTISSVDYMANNTATSDRSTPMESTESEEILTIDNFTDREAILTTTENNSLDLQTPKDTIDTKKTTTTSATVYDKNLDPIVGFSDESFGEFTDSVMDEENFSKDFESTSYPITANDNELEISETNDYVSNNSETESTTPHLPFCDNTVLINSIRKVINNFTMDSANLEETSTDIPNEELAPEILEIPNLRSFLSLPQIENVVVKNVKDHLSKFAGLSKNALKGVGPGDLIRNTLRNILGVLPRRQPELPPMTVEEHQFQNDRWTTNLVTLAPIEPLKENQNFLQHIHEHIKNLIFNPAVGLQTAKQNAVQNIIVQAVKHQMENANGVAIEEDTIRDIVGNVLGNTYEEEQNKDEGNSYENSSVMEDTTERLKDESDYDEGTTIEGNVLENFYEDFEQITTNSPLMENFNDVGTTTDTITKLYTEDLVGNVQFSSTEVNERDNNSKNSPSLSKEISPNCSNQNLSLKNNSINTKPTTASFTGNSVGSVKLSSTDINKETNDFNANQSLDQNPSMDSANRFNPEPTTIAKPVTSNIINVETVAMSSTESYPEFSSTRINEETDSTSGKHLNEEQLSDINSEQSTIIIPSITNANNIESTTVPVLSSAEINDKNTETSGSPNLGQEQPTSSNNINSQQATVTVSVTTNAPNIESTTVSEFPSAEITDNNAEASDSPNLGQEQPNSSNDINSEETSITVPATTNAGTEQSNYDQNDNVYTTDSTTNNLQEDCYTKSTIISETTKDLTNINEETTLGVSHGDQQQTFETTKKNKGETNDSEVLRLPQNSFVEVGNTEMGESSSTNQGRSSQGKEKCRLCKMESCTSTHEIVTKVHKRIKTTTKKYYGVKENVASEGNPIVSSKHQEEDRSTLVGLESRENVNRSNNNDDDVSTTCENLSEENLPDSESNEDFFYKERISKKNTNADDKDDFSDLQNSELYYVGDNVKLPLEIKKLKDGTYALSISKSICENVLKRKCPCCVPLDGNVRSVRRSPANNGNTDRVAGKRKSAEFRSKEWKKRTRRSTVTNKESNWNDSIFKNELETLTMPVTTFAKKYNLKLNLDDGEIENTTRGRLKRVNRIDKDNIDIESKRPLIEQPNEITRDKNEFKEDNNVYRDDDRVKSIDTDNPVFQRMKFINEMRQNPEIYRRQRATERIANSRTEIIKSVLHWLRTVILD